MVTFSTASIPEEDVDVVEEITTIEADTKKSDMMKAELRVKKSVATAEEGALVVEEAAVATQQKTVTTRTSQLTLKLTPMTREDTAKVDKANATRRKLSPKTRISPSHKMRTSTNKVVVEAASTVPNASTMMKATMERTRVKTVEEEVEAEAAVVVVAVIVEVIVEVAAVMVAVVAEIATTSRRVTSQDSPSSLESKEHPSTSQRWATRTTPRPSLASRSQQLVLRVVPQPTRATGSQPLASE